MENQPSVPENAPPKEEQKITPPAEKPSRPLTPFFLFCEKARIKGEQLSSKELGQKWRNLEESERNSYINEYREMKQNYDKYLEEKEGIHKNCGSTLKKKSEVGLYKPQKIRSLVAQKKEIRPMHHLVPHALAKVLVFFEIDVRRISKVLWKILVQN